MAVPEFRAWVCHDAGAGRIFAVFNDGRWTDELIDDSDIVPVALPRNNRYAAMAWSAGCDWYFVVTDAGIVLARPGVQQGVMCQKKSWRFVAAFVEAPQRSRGCRR